uniref:Uncharacterized protein n=1 Tax=Triticum urartu TaxID=4572 RepID=A0A8R7TCQ7_TRIUA
MLRILFTFQKYPPTTALTHSSSLSRPPLTHPFLLPSRSPSSPASPRHRHRPLLAAVTGLSSTPFLSTTKHLVSSHRAPRTIGQKLDFLGADDELLGGGGWIRVRPCRLRSDA